MHHRDSRPYAYDDQHTYPSHPPHNGDYTTSDNNQSFDETTGHFYAPPLHSMGGGHANNPASPYFRSMTPSLVPAHRYASSSRDGRYFNAQGAAAPSSPLSQTMYAPQTQHYPSQYLPTSDQRSLPINQTSPTQAQFIPTPSEIASSYSNYTHQMTTPHSPTIPEGPYSPSTLDYPSPLHMISPSHGGHGHRPRILTGRPRTASSAASTSPTSVQSPSSERFPCEKCGKTFSRSHDRKRHHETQHLASPVIHRCRYCEKEFSRADSLKRHIDNGCDEMP